MQLLTLGSIEDASLTAFAQSLVEVASERRIADGAQAVVGKDVFLESLAAMREGTSAMRLLKLGERR